jgi:hypothetical protein
MQPARPAGRPRVAGRPAPGPVVAAAARTAGGHGVYPGTAPFTPGARVDIV